MSTDNDENARTIKLLQSDIKMLFFSIATLAAALLRGVAEERYMLSIHAIKHQIDRVIEYELTIKKMVKKRDG